jgi:hypothetical protein
MLQKTAVKYLTVGMFVADLNRRWMDTPFLLQGLMLENTEEIAQLQAHCQCAVINLVRSSGPEFEQKPQKKVSPTKRELRTEPIVVVNRAAAPKPLAIEELRAANQAQASARFIGRLSPT